MDYLDLIFGFTYNIVIDMLFQFFLICGGIFLLYSLIWKKMDKEKHYTSLIHGKLLIFYIMAILVVVIDVLWQTYLYLFLSQLILFLFASVISYLNYKNNKKGKFLKYYFIAMLLSLAVWVLNALVAVFFNWDCGMVISTYILNMIVFFLFLFGVIKFSK